MLYADIILPLALPKRSYTYTVPEALAVLVQQGVRVEVPFGRSKLYSGLVDRIHDQAPAYATKAITAVLDEVTVVTPYQLKLWEWIADYYCCSMGEVMQAALPAHLKLSSETKLVYNDAFGEDLTALDSEEYLVAEALLLQQEATVDDARKILNKKTVFPVIQRLLNKGVLYLREDLQEKFRPRRTTAVRLTADYAGAPEKVRAAFGLLDRSEKQLEVLMAFLTLQKSRPFVLKSELLDKAGASDSTFQALKKKNILETYDRELSRLGDFSEGLTEADALTAQQVQALAAIKTHFQEKKAVLLQGVTGSGKTRVYIELIRETLQQGGQVLYLLPEIGLTTQIIQRLQRVFGNDVAVYHSKISNNERVEIWRNTAAGQAVVLSARSGLFLPFRRLQLVIVDEEHDPSFKQYDPAPRYHARDAALYLAQLYDARVLLGTATPSVETYYNAATGKYGLVEMNERFGGLELPETQTIDLREQYKTKRMQSIFSQALLEQLEQVIDRGGQAILFQNRRGYAPSLQCGVCGWTAMCRHCDISLTYHKYNNRLCCHYCGYQQEPVNICPACGSGKVTFRGFGTEKIEDELKLFLPNARIARMDLDTAGSKNKLTALLDDFEARRIDILVGTQMVTKGLDFDNVALVGVLSADSLLKYPDFRASERAFQLLTQVAGRAGRKQTRGLVLLQAFDPKHPVLQEVLRGDFQTFIRRELAERETFHYPPFYRLIHLEIRHKDARMAQEAAVFFAKTLQETLGARVLGPALPAIPRLRGYFGQDIMLKMEKSMPLLIHTKKLIRHTTELLLGRPGFSQTYVAVDVDPV